MQVNLKNLVSMTEANQNFSKVARLVDENGAAVILKNNVPKYVIIEYNEIKKEDVIKEAKDKTVEEVSKRILSKHIRAFEELAK